MNNDLILEPEPELLLEPEPEPEPQELGAGVAVATVPALMQVLPADFPLPRLIRFIPDPRLRAALDESASYAINLTVHGPDGLTQADAALIAVRNHMKAIEENFSEPTTLANQLHKSLTSARGEWLARGDLACKTVGQRIYAETQRLKALADEERRKQQEEENRKLREQIARQAEEARKAEAPAAVVENLFEQAKTAQAPPVSTAATAPPKLAGSTTVKKWTSTIKGTPRDAAQQPAMVDLSDEQWAVVRKAMQAVLDGSEKQRQIFEINWSYLDKRAKGDEATFAIEGFEAYDAGGLRAKGGRKA